MLKQSIENIELHKFDNDFVGPSKIDLNGRDRSKTPDKLLQNAAKSSLMGGYSSNKKQVSQFETPKA